LEIAPTIYFGGKYPASPLRHRSRNRQKLSDLAAEIGIPISNKQSDADIFLALDFNETEIEILRERISENKFNILFRNEPRCVLPQAYSPEIDELFNLVISFGSNPSEERHEYWPQYWTSLNTDLQSTRDIENVVLVNANKLNLSESELYSLRRKCFGNIKNIVVFGEDWNSSFTSRLKVLAIEILKDPVRNLFAAPSHVRYWFRHWPQTLSPVDKSEILVQYKVCLVIENETSYLSEKLFDAFISGCIPVYVGPDVSSFGIPKNLVFQANPDVHSIEEQINLAIHKDYAEYVQQLNEWFSDPETINNHKGEIVMTRALTNSIKAFMNHRR
jgi:hypothetical protein